MVTRASTAVGVPAVNGPSGTVVCAVSFGCVWSVGQSAPSQVASNRANVIRWYGPDSYSRPKLPSLRRVIVEYAVPPASTTLDVGQERPSLQDILTVRWWRAVVLAVLLNSSQWASGRTAADAS
ncbi:hypothetical protein ACH4M4_33615 [Streptomyces sp. NPDC017254]|uniref:hypothetical protein n=1 Tax=unclassified Streptomyces TaxID=2593676 RepID=UPI0037A963DB